MAATGFHTADELNALLPGTLPGLLGIVIDSHEPSSWRPTATCTPAPW
jgi:1,4-dihydroxy-2-naphthoyl-CoA hydrolase